MTDPDLPTRLPCGAELDELTTQAMERTRPADPLHQASCTHCRAALAELHVLWAPVHVLADTDVPPPTDLVARVLDEIQDLDYSGGRAVLRTDDGDTAIAVRVVALIARRAADSVDGTLLALSRARSDVGVGAVGRSVVVQLELVAAMHVSLPLLSARIRSVVRSHVTALTGLSVVAVDVTVVEVAAES